MSTLLQQRHQPVIAPKLRDQVPAQREVILGALCEWTNHRAVILISDFDGCRARYRMPFLCGHFHATCPSLPPTSTRYRAQMWIRLPPVASV